MTKPTHPSGFFNGETIPNVLLRCVKQRGYSVGFESGVIFQELDGGAPSYHRL